MTKPIDPGWDECTGCGHSLTHDHRQSDDLSTQYPWCDVCDRVCDDDDD